MKTRSQLNYPTIDFDDAHLEWMLNKKKRENGTFVYICGKPLKNGIVCKNRNKGNGCGIHVCWDKKFILG